MHPLPASLEHAVAGRTWELITIGESVASVYRLITPNQSDLILKYQRRDPLRNLEGEVARMRWLSGKVAVPEIIDFIQDETHDWLLMTALPGGDATTSKLSPHDLVPLLAQNLRELHALNITHCPFSHSIDHCILDAKSFLDAGRVSADDFAPENIGRDPAELFAELLATKPAPKDQVLTHGDCCLPNLMFEDHRFTGWIDLGYVGLSDPYRDLALIEGSLLRNLGPGYRELFFERYGLSHPDQSRLRFFRLLDELL